MRVLIRIGVKCFRAVRTLVKHLARMHGHVFPQCDGLFEGFIAHTTFVLPIREMHISLVTQHGTPIGRNLSTQIASGSSAIMSPHMLLETVLVLMPGSADVALNLGLRDTSVLQLMSLEGSSSTYNLGADVAHGTIVAMRHFDVRAKKGLVGKSIRKDSA